MKKDGKINRKDERILRKKEKKGCKDKRWERNMDRKGERINRLKKTIDRIEWIRKRKLLNTGWEKLELRGKDERDESLNREKGIDRMDRMRG